MMINKEIIILGGGMVGLSVAHQLIERKLSKNTVRIHKEACESSKQRWRKRRQRGKQKETIIW